MIRHSVIGKKQGYAADEIKSRIQKIKQNIPAAVNSMVIDSLLYFLQLITA